MEDDLKEKWKWKTTSILLLKNYNDDLKKKRKGRRPKNKKNGRQPQKNLKMEDQSTKINLNGCDTIVNSPNCVLLIISMFNNQHFLILNPIMSCKCLDRTNC
jgi:hypothetical protein